MSFHRPGHIWVPEAPHLILTRNLEVDVALPPLQYEGWITARTFRPDRGVFTKELTFRNLITNAALNALGASGIDPQGLTQFAAVGTGTAAPTNGDTQLQSQGGARTATGATGDNVAGVGSTVVPYWQWWRRARMWAVGGATGTWTEVGFFSASSGGTMFNRQLFKDQAGNPTSFVVLADEELWLDLYIRLYPPTNDVTGSVTITGSGTHDYTVRAINVTGLPWYAQYLAWPNHNSQPLRLAETNVLVAQTSNVSSTGANSRTQVAYATDSFYRDQSSVWDPVSANFGTGVGTVVVNRIAVQGTDVGSLYQLALTPKVLKNSTHRLTLSFRTPWGRYTGAL